MRNIKKILVPIDFCEESASAMRRGLALAMESSAELVALHIIHAYSLRHYFMSTAPGMEHLSPAGGDCPIISLDVLRSERAVKLSTFIDRHAARNRGIVITQRIRMGSVVKEIAATAWEENIDLLIVELRKRFPFLNLTVLKLLQLGRTLPCPVLLEPALAKDGRVATAPLVSLRPFPREEVA